jgi:hypothetical protein
MIGDNHQGVHIRGEKESGYLCSPRCAAAYFADLQAKAARALTLQQRFYAHYESHSPAPGSTRVTPESQFPPPGPIQNPKSPVRHESQSPAAGSDAPDAKAPASHPASLPTDVLPAEESHGAARSNPAEPGAPPRV